MGNSRTEYIAKNSLFGLVNKALTLVLGFISRSVFIYFIDITYLGVNGLYSEILQMLSLVELGFGSALIFALYKPVADNDQEKTVKLLDFYKKTYRIIALIMTVIGISFVPFLQYIVKGADNLTIGQLRLYFIIFLINTVAEYFVSYKYSYLNALQKNYISTNINSVVHTIMVVSQIIIIVVAKNFLAYLLTHTVILLISKIFISVYLNKKFPILAQKATQKFTRQEKAPIYKDISGLVMHQFSSIAVHSTDNIIISSLSGMGVVAVGLISNYNLLMHSVLGIVAIMFTGVISSFGNLVASSSSENYRRSFLDVNFINFWIYGFCSIAFFILVPPFITLWLGEEFVIDTSCFFLMVLNAYLVGQSSIYNNARIAKGNFSKDKYLALLQALVNLAVSIVGAIYLGLIGVYIGTIASRLIYVFFRPILTYRFLFEKSCVDYFKRFIKYLAVVLAVGAITFASTMLILKEITIVTFIIAALIVAVLPNAIFFLLFMRSEEFKNVLVRLKNFVNLKLKKKT